jgi:SAM-dependent methyltransferase
VVEISGHLRALWPWRSYTSLIYPEVDLCDRRTWPARQFDLVICEQVLEHVPDPTTAVEGLLALCRPTGFVYVSTPFLIRVHDDPHDYWRFTPLGLETLLRSQGLEPLWVRSWGNRQAIVANFDRWVARFPWQSLKSEPKLPVVVWALAQPANDPQTAVSR